MPLEEWVGWLMGTPWPTLNGEVPFPWSAVSGFTGQELLTDMFSTISLPVSSYFQFSKDQRYTQDMFWLEDSVSFFQSLHLIDEGLRFRKLCIIIPLVSPAVLLVMFILLVI